MSAAPSTKPLVARVRPNGPYIGLLLLAAFGVAFGVTLHSAPGLLAAVSCGVLLAVLGYPVLLSTVGRVPVLVADDDGLRFPLMGPRLAWADIASVRRSVGGRARTPTVPVLLVYPADASAVVSQVRPWLRREARGDLARYGTPLVLSSLSLDRSLDDIGGVIGQRLPGAPRS